MIKEIEINYYAILREERGLNKEKISTDAHNVEDLYQNLKSQHQLSLDSTQLRVAINNEFKDWSSELKSGDNIVFIPPVSGG